MPKIFVGMHSYLMRATINALLRIDSQEGGICRPWA